MKHEIVLAAFAIAVSGDSVPEGQRQKPATKPTVEIEMQIYRVAPPPTLPELLDKVDLFARVEILSSEPRQAPIPGGIERTTLYIAEVKESGRSRRFTRSNDKIRIVQMGGTFEEPDRIVKQIDPHNPPLAAGRSYLLALNWFEERNAYMLAFSPTGVMEIQGGKVFPRGTGLAVRDLRGKALKEVMQRIK